MNVEWLTCWVLLQGALTLTGKRLHLDTHWLPTTWNDTTSALMMTAAMLSACCYVTDKPSVWTTVGIGCSDSHCILRVTTDNTSDCWVRLTTAMLSDYQYASHPGVRWQQCHCFMKWYPVCVIWHCCCLPLSVYMPRFTQLSLTGN